MEKGFKFRIYPNKTQEILIQKSFGCVRFVYNYFLNRKIELYKENKINLTYNQCSKELTKLKQELPWLREPDKDALQKSLKDLDNAYRNFFSKQNKFPKFKSKRNRHRSYRTNANIKFLRNKIQLPKLGKVKIMDNTTTLEGRILNATISQTPDGKYYVSICCTDVPALNITMTNKYIGIDLGLKEFAITSEGIKYENPKYLAKSLKRLKFLQKSLSRKTKGSANREKARLKVARLHSKIFNQRNDFLQKLTTQLIKENDIICLEDLSIKNMIKNHKLAQAISDVSWYSFMRMLTYKAYWYNKKVVNINTQYPSTQICHCCGTKNPKTKDLSIRKWHCSICDTYHDRDINAAINILNEGLRILKI